MVTLTISSLYILVRGGSTSKGKLFSPDIMHAYTCLHCIIVLIIPLGQY